MPALLVDLTILLQATKWQKQSSHKMETEIPYILCGLIALWDIFGIVLCFSHYLLICSEHVPERECWDLLENVFCIGSMQHWDNNRNP